MRIFRKTSINFLAGRKFAYAGSLLVIVLGLGSLAVKGIDLGIDFVGGTEIVLRFKTPPSIADLRSSLAQTGLSASDIKTFGTEGDILIRTREQEAGTAVGDAIKNAVQQSFPGTSFEVLKQYKVSPRLERSSGKTLCTLSLPRSLSSLGTLPSASSSSTGSGQWLRSFTTSWRLSDDLPAEWSHPQINLEITLEVIAAFLTLVGVSVNDTVVVFDRIRENEKLYRSMSLFDVMNKSLNETFRGRSSPTGRSWSFSQRSCSWAVKSHGVLPLP